MATVKPRSESYHRSREVAESARAVLREQLPRARALRSTLPGYDRDQWRQFAELGWLMLCVPEERGGLGFGMQEVCALAQELGRVLAPEPVIPAALLAPFLYDTDLADVLEGKTIVLPAFTGFGTDDDGRLEPVHSGADADAFICQSGRDAILLRGNAGESPHDVVGTHDGGVFCQVRLIPGSGERLALDLTPLREQCALALSAYMLGVAEVAFEITTAYLKDRVQFGQPIGSFQALQHRMVDLYLQLELLRAAVASAAVVVDDHGIDDAARIAVSRAKARANRAANEITRSAIQLHGGMGYTDEADIGLFLRKIMTVGSLLGSEGFHRMRAYDLAEQGA